MSDESTGPRDIYIGERIEQMGVRIDERLGKLRETMSESAGNIHRRLDVWPAAIEAAIERAVAAAISQVMDTVTPLIPVPLRRWEKPPWSWMIVITWAVVIMGAVGGLVAHQILPAKLLDQIAALIGSYVQSVGGSGADLASEALRATPAEAMQP